MDLMLDDEIGALGFFVVEVVEWLVDLYDEFFDKWVAMMIVELLMFSNEDGCM